MIRAAVAAAAVAAFAAAPAAHAATSVMPQPDGGVLVTADVTHNESAGAIREAVLFRYGADGTVDPGFAGGHGVRGLWTPAAFQQPDFKTVNAGTRTTVTPLPTGGEQTETDFAVQRRMPDGSLDPSFGENGNAFTTFAPNGAQREKADDVQMLDDGRILVSGFVDVPQQPDTLVLTSYLPDGSPDPSFDHGRAQIALPYDVSQTHLTLWMGKPVVVAGLDGFVVVRLTPAGAPDPTFGGGDGIVDLGRRNDYSGNKGFAAADAVPDGDTLLLPGASVPSGPNTFEVLRLTAAGDRDTTFGREGIATPDIPGPVGSTVEADAVTVLPLPEGLIVGGKHVPHFGETFHNFGLVRITRQGAVDGSFGHDGWMFVDFDGRHDYLEALAAAPGGKILAGGGSEEGYTSRDVALARLDANGSLDKSFGSGGRVRTQADGTPVTVGPQPSTPLQLQPPIPPAALVPFAKVVVLPSAKRCLSRRVFRIRLRIPIALNPVSATVTVNGKRMKVVKGERLTAPVNLRGLPKGRFTVKIVIRLLDGRKIQGSRKYRACPARRKPRAS